MTRLVASAGVVLLAAAVPAVALPPVPDPSPEGVARHVRRLDSDSFRDREAAAAALELIGEPALDALRSACGSESPETARRAQSLVGRITRRAENEKVLAPTLVEVSAEDAPLEAVLTELSKQSGYGVAVGGPRAGEQAGRKVSVKTGRVPFWDAVLAVCAAADLQVSSAAGYVAPPSPYNTLPPGRRPLPPGGLIPPPPPVLPVLPQPGPIGPAMDAARGNPRPTPPGLPVVLEPCDGKPRPAFVRGAVLVEAVPVPPSAAGPDQLAALLQVWPEPKLAWTATRAVAVTRAADDASRLLAAVPPDPPAVPDLMAGRGQVRVIRQANGGVVVVNPGATVPVPAAFTPSARQAVVRLKPGPSSPAALKELAGTVFGTVRSGVEPLARATLVAGEEAVAGGKGGSELKARLRKDAAGALSLDVELAYEPLAVQPVGPTDPLPGVSPGGGGIGHGNHSVYGVRVTDADGTPYSASPVMVQNRFDPTGRQLAMVLRFALHPTAKDQPAPDAVSFWGTHTRPVEVAFTLADVPVTGGKK